MTTHNPRPRAILVLGMHRSGTSALTRVISLCGAGLPRHLMPASATVNATGFWESQPLVDFHDEVLDAIGSSWSDVRDLPGSWFATREAAAFRTRLGALIDREYAETPLYVVKDPRLCRLLPLWLPVLRDQGTTPLVVIPVRHPQDVAASLYQRETVAAPRALALWQTHMIAAERDSRGLARGFASYDDLLTEWRSTIGPLGRAIGIDLLAGADAGAIESFLSAGLRHHAVAAAAATTLPDWIEATYRWMLQAATGAPTDPARLDRVAAEMAPAIAYFGPLIGALEAELAAKAKERRHWIDTAVERYGIIEDLRREIERLSPPPPDE